MGRAFDRDESHGSLMAFHSVNDTNAMQLHFVFYSRSSTILSSRLPAEVPLILAKGDGSSVPPVEDTVDNGDGGGNEAAGEELENCPCALIPDTVTPLLVPVNGGEEASLSTAEILPPCASEPGFTLVMSADGMPLKLLEPRRPFVRRKLPDAFRLIACTPCGPRNSLLFAERIDGEASAEGAPKRAREFPESTLRWRRSVPEPPGVPPEKAVAISPSSSNVIVGGSKSISSKIS